MDQRRGFEHRNSGTHSELFVSEPEVIEIDFSNVFFNDKECILIIIKNISNLLRAEQQKHQLKYQELLTATLSHELMNPLNSIINLSGLVEQQYYGPKISEELAE